MHLNVNRSQEMLDVAPALDSLSQQVAQNLAAILQLAGIRKLVLSPFPSPGGVGFSVNDMELFGNVPPWLSKYSRSFAEGLSGCMAAFGITSLVLDTESGEEHRALLNAWNAMLAGGKQAETAEDSEIVEPEIVQEVQDTPSEDREEKAPYIPPLVSQISD